MLHFNNLYSKLGSFSCIRAMTKFHYLSETFRYLNTLVTMLDTPAMGSVELVNWEYNCLCFRSSWPISPCTLWWTWSTESCWLGRVSVLMKMHRDIVERSDYKQVLYHIGFGFGFKAFLLWLCWLWLHTNV